MALQFDSEVVRLFVEGDTLRVEGLYRFLCDPSKADFKTLFYPYPQDSLLGAAWTVSLDFRTPGSSWASSEFAEVPDNRGARWRVPLTHGDTLEVRAVYKQTLFDSYFRYIVTTTGLWKRPLKHARFEIFLPDGAVPDNFSFPFKLNTSGGRAYYLYETMDFLPNRDVIAEWTSGSGKSREK
jgi:hypothetical protein